MNVINNAQGGLLKFFFFFLAMGQRRD